MISSDLSASASLSIPSAVNLHFWKPCNYCCKFCFAIFNDDEPLRETKTGLQIDDCRRLIDLLRSAGGEKLNYVGGEPTLCPYLPDLLQHSRSLGFTNSIVTNGHGLERLLADCSTLLDWVGLSVDSAVERVEIALGRGRGGHVARSIRQFGLLRALGIRTKLNTTVTRLTWSEDMSEFVLRVRPDRWKVFQMLPVRGQNDGCINDLSIGENQFLAFIKRHQHLKGQGIPLIAESNDAMTARTA